MKMGDFAWLKRKNSPYLAQNELHSEYNRKISAYLLSLVTYLGKGLFFPGASVV
jgi:hypothetical protein